MIGMLWGFNICVVCYADGEAMVLKMPTDKEGL